MPSGERKWSGKRVVGAENTEFASLVITFGVSTLLKTKFPEESLYCR